MPDDQSASSTARPAQPITVVIASPVRLFSEGLRQCLFKEGAATVVGIAQSPLEACALVEGHHPAVVLVDQALPGALALARGIRLSPGRPQVVALGMPDQEDALLEWAEAGVAGLASTSSTYT